MTISHNKKPNSPKFGKFEYRACESLAQMWSCLGAQLSNRVRLKFRTLIILKPFLTGTFWSSDFEWSGFGIVKHSYGPIHVTSFFSISSCVFQPAFECCAHPKAGQTTFFQSLSTFCIGLKKPIKSGNIHSRILDVYGGRQRAQTFLFMQFNSRVCHSIFIWEQEWIQRDYQTSMLWKLSSKTCW